MDEPEDRATHEGSPYPQLNLNTGVSAAMFIVLVPVIIWTVGLKGDVERQAERMTTAESSIKELRTSAELGRDRQYQSETKLEGRLVGIEGMLRELIARLERRDRQGSP